MRVRGHNWGRKIEEEKRELLAPKKKISSSDRKGVRGRQFDFIR